MIADHVENDEAARAQRHWQLRSEEINNALARSGIQNQSVSGAANADSLIYTIRDHMNHGVAKLRTAVQEIKQSLNIEGIRASVGQGEIQLLIPRSKDIAVPLLDLLARNERVPTMSAALGLAEDGSTVFHNFGSKDAPHLLVVGGQDAGKTVMLRSIAASLAIHNRQSEIQLAAIAPIAASEERQRIQAASWFPLNYLPHMLCDVAVKHTDIIELLTFLSQEVSYREEHSFVEPRLIVLIDQADILLTRGGRQCAEPILHLAQRGESVGVHLVLSTQSIDSATFGTQLMKEMSARLIGRPSTRHMDRDFPTQRDQDSEQLLGEGDFLHRQGNRIQRLQGAYIDDYDLHLKLTQMYRQRAILLAKPVETRLRLDQPADQPSATQTPAGPWPSKNIERTAAVVS